MYQHILIRRHMLFQPWRQRRMRAHQTQVHKAVCNVASEAVEAAGVEVMGQGGDGGTIQLLKLLVRRHEGLLEDV